MADVRLVATDQHFAAPRTCQWRSCCCNCRHSNCSDDVDEWQLCLAGSRDYM